MTSSNTVTHRNAKEFSSGFRLGILGAGQLARMLAEAASRMGITPVVYTDTKDTSAGKMTVQHALGTIQDESALKAFFSEVDLAILESEFLPVDLLERSRGSVEVLPVLSAVAETRDKLKQKQLFQRLGLPTSAFIDYDGRPIEQWIAHAASFFGGSCVFKWGQLGYDGKGVFVLKQHASEKDAAKVFCLGALKKGVSLFAEARVEFRRELAIVGVHSTKAEFASYPLVVSEQYRGICRQVTGPATQLGATIEQETLATEFLKQIAQATGLVGCFAIELFESHEGTLLINELAPRVHNSGHYTQNASGTSQFENHLRAVLGLPLGSTESFGVFVMRNLLGPEGVSQNAEGALLPLCPAAAHLHWYEKDLRPFRKLGHINAVVRDVEALPRAIAMIDHAERNWVDRLRSVGVTDLEA